MLTPPPTGGVNVPTLLVPGNTQGMLFQGGSSATDANGNPYAATVIQVLDKSGTNVAAVDSSGNQQVKVAAGTNQIGHVVLDANTIATYSAVAVGLTPAASCTDLVIINGSASKVIRVVRVAVSALTSAATGVTLDLVLAVRSAANTGTSSALTAVPFDANDAAASATAVSYAANPTPGALVGNIFAQKFQQSLGTPTATDFPTNQTFVAQWGITDSKPIVLRGVAQGLAINFNGVSFGAGASVDVVVEWTEAAA